ncbi:sclerostin domain-containing protein 1-like [Bacillus rossius redtenbacheri]|uniref:sclerostin domain-containing protein 1-like n=1 Tax=Bacillus rossius redtenbacheri TaxID=93214 RepID=UPI002FDE62B7
MPPRRLLTACLMALLSTSADVRATQGPASSAATPPSFAKRGHEAGCKELRSQRYVSDGKCSTKRPISEVVCAEWCVAPAAPPGGGSLSAADRSSYYGEADWRAWRRRRRGGGGGGGGVRLEKWWCAAGATRRRRVKMVCADASVRVYHVRVVKGCRCSRSKPAARTRPAGPVAGALQ